MPNGYQPKPDEVLQAMSDFLQLVPDNYDLHVLPPDYAKHVIMAMVVTTSLDMLANGSRFALINALDNAFWLGVVSERKGWETNPIYLSSEELSEQESQ